MNYHNSIPEEQIKYLDNQRIFYAEEHNQQPVEEIPYKGSFAYLVLVPDDTLDEEFLDIMGLLTNKGNIDYWTNFRNIRKEAYNRYCKHHNFTPDILKHWKDFYQSWVTSDIVEYAKEEYRSFSDNPMKYDSDWKYIDLKNVIKDFVLDNPKYWVSDSYVFYNH